MHQRMRLSIVSLLLVLFPACSSPVATPSTGAPNVPVGMTGPTSTASAQVATVTETDFSRRIVAVARSARASVVAITTVATTEQAPLPLDRSPFDFFGPWEGTPFEFFFPGLPRNNGGRRRQRLRGVGSGVIVDASGLILTNNHVVQGADELTVVLDDESELRAELIGRDAKTDLAVIKAKPKVDETLSLHPATLGDSDGLEVGEWVIAFGSPFGLRQTVSVGIVSAIGRGHMGIADYEDFIQTDAAINPGNSGGALVDLDGRVIGINTAIASRSGGSQGVGFAIPINMAKTVMAALVSNGKVIRGYLGIYVSDLNEDLARSFNYSGQHGVLVQEVSASGPAAKAGLKPGDIIVARDGKPSTEVTEFRNGIAATAPGTTVQLTVFREGARVQLSVRLDALPEEGDQPSRSADATGTGGARRGMGLSDLNQPLKQRFQIDARAGAVVVRVDPGSAAEAAGLSLGDLIVQVGAVDVVDAQSAYRALDAVAANDPVRLRVIRAGRGLFVLLKQPGG